MLWSAIAVDSEALFRKRALAIGLTEEDVLKLGSQGWKTYGTFAMASAGQPGQVADNKLNTSVIDKVMTEGGETRIPCLKRLYLELYSATLADMKRTVEATSEDVAVKVPEVEKMSRMESFQKRYPGAKATGVYEPASSLIDEYIHMVRNGAMRFLDWSRLLSRDDEAKARKHIALKGSSVKWEARSTGLVALAENYHDSVDADLGSDYLVRVALHRRSVAVHVSGLCDFVALERLVNMYFERKYSATPSGYRPVALDQVKAADEAAWRILADMTRGGTTSSGSSVFPASDTLLPIMGRAEGHGWRRRLSCRHPLLMRNTRLLCSYRQPPDLRRLGHGEVDFFMEDDIVARRDAVLGHNLECVTVPWSLSTATSTTCLAKTSFTR